MNHVLHTCSFNWHLLILTVANQLVTKRLCMEMCQNTEHFDKSQLYMCFRTLCGHHYEVQVGGAYDNPDKRHDVLCIFGR